MQITQYPISLNYDELKKRINSYGIKEEQSLSPVETAGNFYRWPFDFSGKQNPKENFMNCLAANSCITLYNGRLYTCGTIAYIDTFSAFFGLDMYSTSKDSIDIYEEDSPSNILRFLARPVPFCRFCNVMGRHNVSYSISNRDISEWS